MNNFTLWIILGVSIVTIMMTCGSFLILYFGKNDKPEHSVSGSWHIELWNIRYGYQVVLDFQNTKVVGRNNLYESFGSAIEQQIDATISREHVLFFEQAGVLWIWNLSTVNPAVVNGYLLNSPVQVYPGDRVEMGNSVFLITRVDFVM